MSPQAKTNRAAAVLGLEWTGDAPAVPVVSSIADLVLAVDAADYAAERGHVSAGVVRSLDRAYDRIGKRLAAMKRELAT